METKLEQKVENTSNEVDKGRRNFLKYLAGGLVGTAIAGGLGYLGYETFREPSLMERIEKIPDNEKKIEFLVEQIYKNPKETRESIFAEEPGSRERYNNFNFNLDKEENIRLEKVYEKYGIDLPEDPKKFSESDKLAIFLDYKLIRSLSLF